VSSLIRYTVGCHVTQPTPAAIIRERCRAPDGGRFTVETELQHFALITYAVPPERLRPLIHPAFPLRTVWIDGEERALLSVVPFLDRDFRARQLPWPRFSFGQTNYRIYVRYRGEDCAWFLGTTLASPSVVVPRWLWRLPWYYARTSFDARYDKAAARYTRYQLATRSAWGAAEVTLADTGQPMGLLPGFDDPAEQQLVVTHPIAGYFWRRDGRLGTYSIWHDEMRPTLGSVQHARFALLERLGILGPDEALRPHSVLLQRSVSFQIHLPPRCLSVA
jgi:hypothetical protein